MPCLLGFQNSFWDCQIPSESWSFIMICVPSHNRSPKPLLNLEISKLPLSLLFLYVHCTYIIQTCTQSSDYRGDLNIYSAQTFCLPKKHFSGHAKYLLLWGGVNPPSIILTCPLKVEFFLYPP